MKKTVLFLFALSLLWSCNKDDETMIPQCAAPSNLSENNITSTSASISWTDANDMGTFKVEYGISGFMLGSGTQITTTQNTLTLSGLSANTTYDYYVQSICSVSNTSVISMVRAFTTLAPPVSTEFRSTLSQMNIFSGQLKDLNPSVLTFEYNLNTTLFTDYTSKQRLIALPNGESMTYTGDGLPDFPNNTVIAKTFYYNIDDRNPALGKTIMETRVMIKQNGTWEFGDYVWNNAQTEARLETDGSIQPVSWIDSSGSTRTVNYEIPTIGDCFTCHQDNSVSTLIGPKLRSMNFNLNGVNQLQKFISNGHLAGAPNPSNIGVLPDWTDTTLSDEVRTRAYFDMNCAHCHAPGGYHNVTFYDAMDLRFETSFNNSKIFDFKDSISIRLQTSVEGYSMPLLGVTSPHAEAVELIVPYLESLQ